MVRRHLFAGDSPFAGTSLKIILLVFLENMSQWNRNCLQHPLPHTVNSEPCESRSKHRNALPNRCVCDTKLNLYSTSLPRLLQSATEQHSWTSCCTHGRVHPTVWNLVAAASQTSCYCAIYEWTHTAQVFSTFCLAYSAFWFLLTLDCHSVDNVSGSSCNFMVLLMASLCANRYII